MAKYPLVVVVEESSDLDLEALNPDEIHPAAYYALCREAERRGIPVGLDDPKAPATVAELIAAVADHREQNALRDALRVELTEAFGLGYADVVHDRIEQVDEATLYESWVGCHVVLAYDVSDDGDVESGPRVCLAETRWVNVVEEEQRYALCFASTSDTDSKGNPNYRTVEVEGSPREIARTLVGVLRAAGYEDNS